MGADQMPGLPHWDPQASGDFHKNFKFCSFHSQNLFTLALQRTLSAPAGQAPGICISRDQFTRLPWPGGAPPNRGPTEFHELLYRFV